MDLIFFFITCMHRTTYAIVTYIDLNCFDLLICPRLTIPHTSFNWGKFLKDIRTIFANKNLNKINKIYLLID